MAFIALKEDNSGLDSLVYNLEEKKQTWLYTKFVISYEDNSHNTFDNKERITNKNDMLYINKQRFNLINILYVIFILFLIMRYVFTKFNIRLKYKFKGKFSTILRHLPSILKWLLILDAIYILILVIITMQSMIKTFVLFR